MRFVQKVAVALLVIGLALGVSAGCAAGEKPLNAQEKVYAQARELGYDGTLDEFLRLVAGRDGANGKDGASVSKAAVNEKGELIVTLTDGTLVNAGSVRGEKGDKGEDGKDGQDGADGKDGQNGADGHDGQDGADGSDGENGQDGQEGKDGASWLFGAGAPREALGKTNDLYLDGETYDVYIKVSQGWRKVGNVKGEDGADGSDGQDGSNGQDGQNGSSGQDGKDGAAWYCGTGMPDPLSGMEGDFYLDTENYDLYRRAAEWEKLGNIRGEDALRGTVTVSYDAGAGAFENGDTAYFEEIPAGDYASMPVPLREGYIFAGWYCGAGASAAKLTALTAVTKDLALSAKWMPRPKINYITDSLLHTTEGQPLPSGEAEIGDFYGVSYYEWTINGNPSEEFFCTVTQISLGRWGVSVGSAVPAKLGYYDVAIALYGEFGEISVRFSYTVTVAPVLGFTKVFVNGQENDSEIASECGEAYEIELLLESSYAGVTHKIISDHGDYTVTESGNTFENDRYFLTVLFGYEQDAIRIKLSIVFKTAGDYAFIVESQAIEGAKASFELTFHAEI